MSDFLDHLVTRSLGLAPPAALPPAVEPRPLSLFEPPIPQGEPLLPEIQPEWPAVSSEVEAAVEPAPQRRERHVPPTLAQPVWEAEPMTEVEPARRPSPPAPLPAPTAPRRERGDKKQDPTEDFSSLFLTSFSSSFLPSPGEGEGGAGRGAGGEGALPAPPTPTRTVAVKPSLLSPEGPPRPPLSRPEPLIALEPRVEIPVPLPVARPAAAEPAPVIHVTIGRVEVRAAAPAGPAPARRPSAPAVPTLAEYLRRRDRRDR